MAMLPETSLFMTTYWPKLSDEGQAKVASLMLEYGVGHRDLIEAEIQEAAKMLNKIVREDFSKRGIPLVHL